MVKQTRKKRILIILAVLLLAYPAWLGSEYLQMFLQANNSLAMSTRHYDEIVVYRWGKFRNVYYSPDIRIYDLAWSPDGKKIAFVFEEGPFGTYARMGSVMVNIGLLDVQSGEMEKLFSFESGDDSDYFEVIDHKIAWSPDGTRILFDQYVSGNGVQFHLFDMQTKEILPEGISVPDVKPASIEPDWNPGPFPLIGINTQIDGKRESRIYSIDTDFTKLTYIIDGENPKWWPASEGRFTFSRNFSSDYRYFSGDIHGENVQVLMNNCYPLAQSFTGRFIVHSCTVDDYTRPKLYMYDTFWKKSFYFSMDSFLWASWAP